MQLIEKYLGEAKEMSFNKANFMKVIKSGKGLVVYGTGSGYSDTKEFGLSVDQIKKATEKGKIDMLFKNAQMAVKGAKDPEMKGRKFMVRMDERNILSEALDMRTIGRYIPTGAKVMAALGIKNLKLTFIESTSAPPLTTSDIKNIETRVKKNVEMFVKDVGASIKLKGVDYEPYVFMQGQKNSIDFIYSFRLNVSTKPEEKKLAALYKALK